MSSFLLSSLLCVPQATHICRLTLRIYNKKQNKNKRTKQNTKKKLAFLKLQDYRGKEGNTSWKLKCRSQQSIHEKKKSPSSKPYPEYGAGAYLVLESPWKCPSCVTQVSRAWADSYCIICMANQPQVLSAPSRSSAGSLEEPFNSPKRNTILTPSLSQTNPALKQVTLYI